MKFNEKFETLAKNLDKERRKHALLITREPLRGSLVKS